MLKAFFALLTCLAHAADYYVSSTGSDGNPGTLALPWRSVTPVNAATFAAGDRIFFEGGQTFPGGISLTNESGAAGNPIVLGSYGTGRATLTPSAGTSGLLIASRSYIEVRDLVFTGLGRNVSTVEGIHIRNTTASTARWIRVDNCEASGFGQSGLMVDAVGAAGYDDVRVTNSQFHHNRFKGLGTVGNWTQVPRPNRNLYVSGCKFYSNWGVQGSSTPQGGLVLMGISNAMVERCEAYDNGGDPPYGSGIIGFWCWSADHVTFQFNESHHNRQNGVGSDGGGFDFDGATTDSLMQYNYSHHNDGAGFLLAQFPWAYLSGELENNVIRYNVSEYDGQSNGYGAVTVWGGGGPDRVSRTEIYNNTFYVGPAVRGGVPCAVNFFGYDIQDVAFYNNIFVVAPGHKFIEAGGDLPGVVFKRNVYHNEGGGSFHVTWNTYDYYSLASWIAASSPQQEYESGAVLGLTSDPLLSNPGFGGTIGDPTLLDTLTAYRLQGASPLRDAGLALATRLLVPSIPGPGFQDYYGSPLPLGTGYEIGAHELAAFTPTPTATISPTFTASPEVTATPSHDLPLLYPNPFDPGRERFHVANAAAGATVTFYNMIGEKVYAFSLQGSPSLDSWDGVNLNGAPVVTGVYLMTISGKPGVHRVAVVRDAP